MATIEINKKENDNIDVYTPYNESNDVKINLSNNVIRQIAYNNYMPYNNATDVIQAVANEVISSEAAYWEEILLPNKPDDIDLSLAKICNDGQFFVIFCPYNIENNHYMYSWNSTDGGYTWYQNAFSNNNANTQINQIQDVKVVKTALGHRAILIGTTINNSNTIYNIYTVLFSYLSPTQIAYYLTEFENPYSDSYLPFSNGLVKTPRGFFLLNNNTRRGQQDLFVTPYTYNKSFAQNGISSQSVGTFTFYTYSWDLHDEYDSIFYDETLHRFVGHRSDNDSIYITYEPYDYTTTTYFVNSEVNDACQAFGRCLFFDADAINQTPIKYISFPTQWNAYGKPVFGSLSQFNSASDCKQWIFGNKYRLYNIDEQGNVYYKKGLNENWIESNQSSSVTNTTFIPLKSIMSSASIQNAQFVSANDNSDIVGIIRLNNIYKIIHTHMGNVR